MKANELRLGNLILHKREITHVYQIERRYKTVFRINDIEVDERIIGDYYQPIPLSPEILEACGFEKKINEMQIDGIEMTLEIDDDTWFSSCGGLNGTLAVLCLCRGNYFAKNLSYLHQLQNLYFALTGTELSINLEKVKA